MGDKFNRLIYNEKFCIVIHSAICIAICVLIFAIVWFSKIVSVHKLLDFVNSDIVNLSATIAGFEFAGVSIFISLEGNKKMQILKKLDGDKIIYKIYIYSIVSFLISIILMVLDINLLTSIECTYLWVRILIQTISIYMFLLGLTFFLSSMRLISWMLKN